MNIGLSILLDEILELDALWMAAHSTNADCDALEARSPPFVDRNDFQRESKRDRRREST